MLLNLRVQNFALIEDVNIEFKKGLTVLTGETGTGKSIILEAIYLLFGKRSDQDMIRFGEDQAIVEGLFLVNEDIQKNYMLPEKIKVKRIIDRNGRHQMYLNNTLTTLKELKDVMNNIGSMHSQTDTLVLLDQSSYLNIIDQIDKDKINKVKNDYIYNRSIYLESLKHLEKLKKQKLEDQEKMEFYEYQLKELKSYNLVENELEEIEEKIKVLENFDKLSNNLKESYYLLKENINLDSLYTLSENLLKISQIDKSFNNYYEKVSNYYYELIEIQNILSDEINNLDFDENEFNLLQERSFELRKIEDKYNKNIKELIKYINELEEKIYLITDYDNYIKKLEKEVLNNFNKAYEKGLKLRKLRKELSKELIENILIELKDLDLENTKFEVSFNDLEKTENELLEDGLDQIDFLISLNEGEPIKPLSKVASGGERARFMFALKSYYAIKNNLSLLVLDEIDIGISGKTAAKVANKMNDISKEIQLIVISHLPQVAAKADYHYGIDKTLINNRMTTNIKLLEYEQRVKKIALMLSDESLSHYAIEQAKELLKK